MKIPKRRRREGKTDYKSRISLLKSNLPRIVIRKTNRYIITQIVKSKEAQDYVVVGVTSKTLLDYGFPKEWGNSLKSIPASYLTGFLLGKRILDKKEAKKIEAILDIGLIRNVPGSRVYAVVKGLVDAGIILRYEKDILPDENRIKGMHMKKDIIKILDEVKGKIENG